MNRHSEDVAALEIPVSNDRIISRGASMYEAASQELAQQSIATVAERAQLRAKRRVFVDGFVVGFIVCLVLTIAILAARGVL